MAVAFTGTNTGRAYVSGQVYSNGNGVYRAERDGTFTNLKTGNSLVGSSRDPRVTFFNVGGGSMSTSGSGAGNGAVRSGVRPGNGPGNAGVINPGAGEGPGRAGVLPAVPGAAGPGLPGNKPGGGSLSPFRRDIGIGQFDAGVPEKITDIYIDGWKYPRNPKTSDASDIEDSIGEAEFPSIAWVVNQAAQLDNLWYSHPYKPSLDLWADQQRARLKAKNAADAKQQAWEANPSYRLETWESDWATRRQGFDLSGPGL